MTYRYRILSKSEDRQREKNEASRREMDLAFIAAEVASLKLKIKLPRIRFITLDDDGYISRNQPIDGYSPPGKDIFLRTGMTPARLVDITLHECRHCWQWSQPLWAGRNDDHCEKDSRLWTLEFWGARRVETDPEKIIPQLCEIGLPLAMSAGDEQAAGFYIEELKAVGHPAAARLDKQYTEWCRIREHAQTRASLHRVTPAGVTLDEIRKNYYEKILPAQYEAFLKPHLRMFQGIYP